MIHYVDDEDIQKTSRHARYRSRLLVSFDNTWDISR